MGQFFKNQSSLKEHTSFLNIPSLVIKYMVNGLIKNIFMIGSYVVSPIFIGETQDSYLKIRSIIEFVGKVKTADWKDSRAFGGRVLPR